MKRMKRSKGRGGARAPVLVSSPLLPELALRMDAGHRHKARTAPLPEQVGDRPLRRGLAGGAFTVPPALPPINQGVSEMRVLSACAVSGVLFLAACGGESAKPAATTSSTTTTEVPTTTTVMPVPTTVPTTTTTIKRVVTTTTTEPEPEVQGTAVQTDAGDDLDEWRAIALCEMPGPGGVPSEPWGAHWSFKGTWSGAFGIYNGTWLGAGGGKYGPTAGHATWQQQVEIARVIRNQYGYGAWGCGRKLGLG